MGNLIVSDLGLQMVAAVRPLVARIKKQDRSLAEQLVRAASSVCLNTAEADYSDPGNKRARLFNGGRERERNARGAARRGGVVVLQHQRCGAGAGVARPNRRHLVAAHASVRRGAGGRNASSAPSSPSAGKARPAVNALSRSVFPEAQQGNAQKASQILAPTAALSGPR